jgi:hypothetical protein
MQSSNSDLLKKGKKRRHLLVLLLHINLGLLHGIQDGSSPELAESYHRMNCVFPFLSGWAYTSIALYTHIRSKTRDQKGKQ